MAAAAWTSLAWLWLSVPSGSHAAHAPEVGLASIDTLATVALMSLAMMAPLVLGATRHAALTTFWTRRHRAACLFLVGYLAIWIAAGALISAVIFGLAARLDWWLVTAVAFTAAGGWQFSPAKRRALRRCERRTSVHGDGWRADRACLSNGAAAGVACAASCLAIMGAAAASHHALPILLGLFAVQVGERRAWRFRAQRTAAWIAAVGIAAVAMSIVS